MTMKMARGSAALMLHATLQVKPNAIEKGTIRAMSSKHNSIVYRRVVFDQT